MSIRHALFIDDAWFDSSQDTWNALVVVHQTSVEIKPYTNAEVTDMVRFSFEEFAAIVEFLRFARGERRVDESQEAGKHKKMVARAQGKVQP